MYVPLHGRKNRKVRAVRLWLKWKKDYENGISVDDIASRYKKKNGKPYNRAYIYEAFRKLRQMDTV